MSHRRGGDRKRKYSESPEPDEAHLKQQNPSSPPQPELQHPTPSRRLKTALLDPSSLQGDSPTTPQQLGLAQPQPQQRTSGSPSSPGFRQQIPSLQSSHFQPDTASVQQVQSSTIQHLRPDQTHLQQPTLPVPPTPELEQQTSPSLSDFAQVDPSSAQPTQTCMQQTTSIVPARTDHQPIQTCTQQTTSIVPARTDLQQSPPSPLPDPAGQRSKPSTPRRTHLPQHEPSFAGLTPFREVTSRDIAATKLERSPLTKANLRRYERSFIAGKDDKTLESSGKLSQDSQPSKLVKRQENLETHRILVNDEQAREKYSAFIDKALKMVDQDRKDTMTTESEVEFRKTDSSYRALNDNSWFSSVWQQLIGPTRDRRPKDDDGEWTKATLLDDGIIAVRDSQFHSNAIPSALNYQDHREFESNPDEDWQQPKPDIAYGFHKDKLRLNFLQLKAVNNHIDLYKVCPFAVGVYFIVESKSTRQSIDEAELQAARGGAALVAASRQLDRLAGLLKMENGKDSRSVAFSLVMVPGRAKLNIHWIQDEAENFVYHSHTLKEYLFSMKNAGRELQTNINNILDWGFWLKKAQILETLERLKGRPQYITAIAEYQDSKAGGATED